MGFWILEDFREGMGGDRATVGGIDLTRVFYFEKYITCLSVQ